jgi:hypothetical protein
MTEWRKLSAQGHTNLKRRFLPRGEVLLFKFGKLAVQELQVNDHRGILLYICLSICDRLPYGLSIGRKCPKSALEPRPESGKAQTKCRSGVGPLWDTDSQKQYGQYNDSNVTARYQDSDVKTR